MPARQNNGTSLANVDMPGGNKISFYRSGSVTINSPTKTLMGHAEDQRDPLEPGKVVL